MVIKPYVGNRHIQSPRKTDFSISENKTLIDKASNTITSFGYLPDLDIVSKNSHNYVREGIKISCLSQLHICVRPDVLHILQPKQTCMQSAN